jgi:hypothetical protein
MYVVLYFTAFLYLLLSERAVITDSLHSSPPIGLTAFSAAPFSCMFSVLDFVAAG